MKQDPLIRRELLDEKAIAFRKKYGKLSAIFLANLGRSAKGFVALSFLMVPAPLLHSLRYDFHGSERTPAAYVASLLRVNLYGYIFFFSILLLASIAEFIRGKIDLRLGYKKVGQFTVKGVENLPKFKRIRFYEGGRLVLRPHDPEFEEATIGQEVEVERTASGKLIGYHFKPTRTRRITSW